MVDEGSDSVADGRGRPVDLGPDRDLESSRTPQPPAEGAGEEHARELIGQLSAERRRVTMVFDPTMAADAARAVRAGGSLASFVEAMHDQEDGDVTVDLLGALAADGYAYRACPTAREAEEEIAAWHDLLHGPPA